MGQLLTMARFLLGRDRGGSYRQRLVAAETTLARLRAQKTADDGAIELIVALAESCPEHEAPGPRYRLRRLAVLGEAHREGLESRLGAALAAMEILTARYQRRKAERATQRAQITRHRRLITQLERAGNFLAAQQELERMGTLARTVRAMVNPRVVVSREHRKLLESLDPVARRHLDGLTHTLDALVELGPLDARAEGLRSTVAERIAKALVSGRKRLESLRDWRPEPAAVSAPSGPSP